MKIIVGLGNPGQEYSATRHNVGFFVVDELARRWGAQIWRNKFDAEIAEHRSDGEQSLLVKPQTYMNLSGTAVGALVRWHKVSAEDVVVIYDDMDLAVGRLRLRTKGSSGGHRGIESLISHLGTDVFARVRVGVGRPPEGWTVNNYVLSKFSTEEAPLIKEAVERSAQAVECILAQGITKAMNTFSK